MGEPETGCFLQEQKGGDEVVSVRTPSIPLKGEVERITINE